MSLEKNIETLESNLDSLERDTLNLDKAVDLYADTIKLAHKTLTQLQNTEQRITKIKTELPTNA